MTLYIVTAKYHIEGVDYLDKSIPYEEQETIISFSPTRVSKVAEVYTCIPEWVNKIRKLAVSRPDCVHIKRDLGDSLFAEVDKSCVRIMPKRQMTEEQRLAYVEHFTKGGSKT